MIWYNNRWCMSPKLTLVSRVYMSWLLANWCCIIDENRALILWQIKIFRWVLSTILGHLVLHLNSNVPRKNNVSAMAIDFELLTERYVFLICWIFSCSEMVKFLYFRGWKLVFAKKRKRQYPRKNSVSAKTSFWSSFNYISRVFFKEFKKSIL